MNTAEILRKLADIIEKNEKPDVTVPSDAGVYPELNDQSETSVFCPPLQQKIELLKKAIGEPSLYDQNPCPECHCDPCCCEDYAGACPQCECNPCCCEEESGYCPHCDCDPCCREDEECGDGEVDGDAELINIRKNAGLLLCLDDDNALDS